MSETTSSADDAIARLTALLPHPPEFADKLEERAYLRFRLAQAFRIFARLHFDEGINGHITVRDPIKPTCFWVNPLGLHFKLIQPSDLILVDHTGKIQDESGPVRLLNIAAFMIHSAIHTARPDVICAAHSHSVYGKAFAALGRTLDPISQDACAFYDDHALFNQYHGPVFEKSEGEAIAQKLGSGKAIILQNHGLLVASQSVEATVFFYSALEKCCQVQILADTAAAACGKQTVKISPEDAKLTGSRNGSHFAGWYNGRMEFQSLESDEGVVYEPPIPLSPAKE